MIKILERFFCHDELFEITMIAIIITIIYVLDYLSKFLGTLKISMYM